MLSKEDANMRKALSVVSVLAALAFLAGSAFAQNMSPESAAGASAAPAAAKASYFVWVVITSGFAMAIASAFCAIGQSRAIAMAVEAIGRQPSAAARIQNVMIIGLALIESLAIYVLLIALVLLFVRPFDSSVLGL
jgi:F-type H+-transporting ATPase subunit c